MMRQPARRLRWIRSIAVTPCVYVSFLPGSGLGADAEHEARINKLPSPAIARLRALGTTMAPRCRLGRHNGRRTFRTRPPARARASAGASHPRPLAPLWHHPYVAR